MEEHIPCVQQKKIEMKSTLIALFSNTWNSFWEESENNSFSLTEVKKSPAYFLAKKWNNEIKLEDKTEIAVFQDTLSDPKDYYSNSYRRFKQVGNQMEDKIRNLFELGFEKRYDRVVFVDPHLIFHSSEIVEQVLTNWSKNSMIFLPQTDGKVALCGMEEAHFWNWENFKFQQNEEIVELLSDCNAKNIAFKLLPSCDISKIESNFSKQFQASSA